METENRKTSQENYPLKTLWVLLSALGLLVIVGMAGYFFFSPDKEEGALKPVLAATTAVPVETPEEFDPIEWARKSEEYPEMVNEEEQDDSFIVELVSEEEAAEVLEAVPEVVEKAPAVPAPVEKAAEPVVHYKDVKVVVYWIQVGSYTSMTKAESVSSDLKDKGLSSVVQVKTVDGNTRYRVRIGEFSSKAEAEKFTGQVQSLDGFEQSYVVQTTVTKQIKLNS